MRKGAIVSILCGAGLGFLLVSMGYGIDTWQFWGILACAIGMVISQTLDD